MTLKQSHKPDGYKELLVYQKAESVMDMTHALTEQFPKGKTMVDLADQMDRSARSVKQNIAEGWMRNKTRQYNEFLGFSVGSAQELKEDCEDIWVGKYTNLESVKGVIGEKRAKGVEKGIKGDPDVRRNWLESLSWYPLDETLPLVVQLYLRVKETIYLIDRLQRSLQTKMENEHGLTQAEKLVRKEKEQKNDTFLKDMFEQRGLVMTPEGVKDKEEARRLGLKEIDPQ